ncbi:hypothetical protein BCR44DRAFT_36675 [Catenaria anguillulae PL171]|uniref:Uncharacterized protein n=1 Tax=Catenaria anguillulae PL171 TaxID=765915 RepID=A0A1Y2HK36_9FUNG|nr:hypothetical protein BCR44DRAFT_36675 [Catenaria anguillulae PL171]
MTPPHPRPHSVAVLGDSAPVEVHPDALTHPSTFTIPETAALDAFRQHLDAHGIQYAIDPDSVNIVHSRKEGLIQFPSLDHMIHAFDRIPFSSYSDPSLPDPVTPELCVPIPIARDLARIEFSLVKSSADSDAPPTGNDLTRKLHSVYKLAQQGVRRLPGPRRTTLLGVLLKSDLIPHHDTRAAATAAVLFNHPDAAKTVHAQLVKHDASPNYLPPVLVQGSTVCFVTNLVDSHGHAHPAAPGHVRGLDGRTSPPRPSSASMARASHSPTPLAAGTRRDRSPSHSDPAPPGPPKKRRIMPTLVQALPVSATSAHAFDTIDEPNAELTLLETAIMQAPPQARYVPSIFGSNGPDPFALLRNSTLPLVLAFDPRADRSSANWLETAPIVYDVLLRTMLPRHHTASPPPTAVTVIPPFSPPGSPNATSQLSVASSWAQVLVSVDTSLYRLGLRLHASGHPENQASVAAAAARGQIPLASADRAVFLGPLATPLCSRTIAGVYSLVPPPTVVASTHPMSPAHAASSAARQEHQQHTPRQQHTWPGLTSPTPQPAPKRASLSSLLSPPPRLRSPPPAAHLHHVLSPALVLIWEAGIPARGVAERVPDEVTVYQLMDSPTGASGQDGGDTLPFATDTAYLRPVARLDVFRIDQLARSITCVQVENECVVIGDDAGGVSVWDLDQLMSAAAASVSSASSTLVDPSAASDVPHLEPPTHIELHEQVHSIACRKAAAGGGSGGNDARVFYIATAKNLFVWREHTLIPVSKFYDPQASILAATVNAAGTHAVLVFPLVVMLLPVGEQAAKMKWDHMLDVARDPGSGEGTGANKVTVRFDPNRPSMFVVTCGGRMQFWDVNDVDNGMFLHHDKPGIAQVAFIDSGVLPNHLVTVDWNAEKARHEVVLVRPSAWVLEAVDRNANVSYYSGQLSPPGGVRRTFGY